MRTVMRSKLASNLSPAEYRELSRLSFRERGCLMYDLRNERYAEGTRVFSLRDADTGLLLSWALVSYGTFMVYTRKAYRRRGYASRIYKQAASKRKHKLRVIPHDLKSAEFFAKNKACPNDVPTRYKHA